MRTVDDQALVNAFAIEIKVARAHLKISQEELAARAGVNRTFVGKIETGVNQPALCTVFRLAAGLGIDATTLIDRVVKRTQLELHRS